jgi:hypothetical protein
MKTCNKCKIEKLESEFYGSDNSCKECRKFKVRQYKSANIDKIREYDRKRSKTEKRISNAQKVSSEWRIVNPERYRAHNLVNNAIRDGKMTKPSCCKSCGCKGIIHGHHDDYAKPLEVMWLCVPCHAARHQQLRSMLAA